LKAVMSHTVTAHRAQNQAKEVLKNLASFLGFMSVVVFVCIALCLVPADPQ
jgi:hypothetical protein